jgi:hypothetical protein
MVRDLLPERPLELDKQYFRSSRNAVKGLFLGVLILCGAASWLLHHDLATIAHERETWRLGFKCVAGSVELHGQRDSDRATLEITCTEEDGSIHHADGKGSWQAFEALYGDPEIRYDPLRPDELALNEALAARDARIAGTKGATIVMLGFGVLMLGIVGVLCAKMWRLRTIVRLGDEMQVEIVRVATFYRGRNPTHIRQVGWRISPTAKVQWSRLASVDGLAWIDATSRRALALVRGDRGVLLTGSLEPAELTTAELAHAKAALENAGGGLMRKLDPDA